MALRLAFAVTSFMAFSIAVGLVVVVLGLVLGNPANLREAAALTGDAVRAVRRFIRRRQDRARIQKTIDDGLETFEFQGQGEFVELGLRVRTGDVVEQDVYQDGDYVVFVPDPTRPSAENVARAAVEYVSRGLMPGVQRLIEPKTLTAVRLTFTREILRTPHSSEAILRAFDERHYYPAAESDHEHRDRFVWMNRLVVRGWFLSIFLSELRRRAKAHAGPVPSEAYLQETASFAQWLSQLATVRPGQATAEGFVHPHPSPRVAVVLVENDDLDAYRAVVEGFIGDPRIEVIYLTAAPPHVNTADRLYGRFKIHRDVDRNEIRPKLVCSLQPPVQGVVARLVMLRETHGPWDVLDYSRRPAPIAPVQATARYMHWHPASARTQRRERV